MSYAASFWTPCKPPMISGSEDGCKPRLRSIQECSTLWVNTHRSVWQVYELYSPLKHRQVFSSLRGKRGFLSCWSKQGIPHLCEPEQAGSLVLILSVGGGHQLDGVRRTKRMCLPPHSAAQHCQQVRRAENNLPSFCKQNFTYLYHEWSTNPSL